MQNYLTVPNKTVTTKSGQKISYRTTGEDSGVPLLMLNHLTGTLDNWDPLLIDLLSERRKVITFDSQGVGLSDGEVPTDIGVMADVTIAFLDALNIKQVDLLGLSMGGFVAQDLILKYPNYVRKLILVGTGPKGDRKIGRVGRITNLDIVRAFFTRRDVKEYLFFTQSALGKTKSKEFLNRIHQRSTVKDNDIQVKDYLRQLKAIKKYANAAPDDIAAITQPTLVVNGDSDRMVPTQDSHLMASQIPNAQLKIYQDAGHMSLFQDPFDFVDMVNEFL